MIEPAHAGQPMFVEVARLTNLELVDLPTGHWPMWSRPDDLAKGSQPRHARAGELPRDGSEPSAT